MALQERSRHQPGPQTPVILGAGRDMDAASAHRYCALRSVCMIALPATSPLSCVVVVASIAGCEAADVPGQLRTGHRRGELPPDQVRDDGRALIWLREVSALTPRDLGD